MFPVIRRASTAVVFCAAFLYTAQAVHAQVAPTTTASITGSVSDTAGKPVANAKVTLTGPKAASTQTDSNGLFVFIGLPFGTYSISAAAAGLGTATRMGVSVQGDTNVAIEYEPENANGLKVIANVSSVTSAQFNVTAASITQVNPMQAAFDGVTSWRKVLGQIPGISTGGLGCGHISQTAFPDSPMLPTKISINGALPYETAVLFDNMPVVSSSYGSLDNGTNLSLFPLNAFSSADVVRGPGANAPSIVDSIGGSLLLHAPGPVDSNHYDLSVSTDPYGGLVTNALVAFRAGKLSTTITYGVNDSPGPLNQTAIPAFGYYNAPAIINGHDCEGYYCGSVASYQGYPNPKCYSYTCISGYNEDFVGCCMNMSSAWSQHTGSMSINYAVSPKVNATVFYSGASGYAQFAYCDYRVTFVPPAGYTGGLQAGNYLFNEGPSGGIGGAPFQQNSSMFEEKISAQLGRGVLTLAALQNKTMSFQDFWAPHSSYLTLYGGATVCSNTSAGCSTGSYVPTIYNGVTVPVTFSAAAYFYEYYGSQSRDLSLNYATPIGENGRIGASFVQSTADLLESFVESCYPSMGVPNSPSSYLFGKFGSPEGSETTNEARVFAGIDPTEKTSLDLSAYFVNVTYHVPNPNLGSGFTEISPGVFDCEVFASAYTNPHYSFTAPRLGFVWRPTAATAVRAAVGGGFAEAPLTDMIGINSSCPTSAPTCSMQLVNLGLQPEKSFGFDVGTDIRLHQNNVISFDVYRTNLFGQFYQSSVFKGLGTCPGNTVAPCYATEYGNLGVSRYEGVLLDIHHDVPRGTYWSFSGGLTRGYVVSVPGGFYNNGSATCDLKTGAGCANLTVVPGVNFNGTFAAAIPYSQALGTLGYRWNPYKYMDLIATYYGNNNSYFRPAFVEVDGHVGYPVSKTVSLLMTFRNITGVYDSPVLIYGPSAPAPELGGYPPYGVDGQNYGPRTVILTMNVKM